MKKMQGLLVILLIASFFLFAAASSDKNENVNQGQGSATNITQGDSKDNSAGSSAQAEQGKTEDNESIGDYKVIIDSCRLAESYDDTPVVIVKYIFTNVKDENASAFMWALQDAVYQNGVGLNKAYILEDSANYNADNQTKEIKKGATIEVEVAYTLNDTTTDIEVEVKELISFDDKTITKTFSIAE